jgi:hypothetical protein
VTPSIFQVLLKGMHELVEPVTHTVCLDATSWVVCSDECDDGKIGPTRCAVIGAVRGDR